MKFLFLSAALAMGPGFVQANVFGDLESAQENTVPEMEILEANEAPKHMLFQIDRKSSIPQDNVAPYDPINKKYYQKAFAGKTYKAPFLAGYDYWRYVTVYNVRTVAERVAYLPYFEEDCHDASWAMAEWGESRSLKVSLGSSLGAEALGLKASVTMSIESGVTFSASRRIQAVKGIAAKHYPYKLSDTWEGVTYIQVYWKDKNKYGYLTKPLGFNRWQEYPFPFALDNQNVGFKVKRELTRKCSNYDPEADPVNQSALYIR